MRLPQGAPARRGLVSEGVVYGLGLAVQRGGPVLVLAVAARLLGAHDLGVATTAVAASGLLAIVFGLGVGAAVVRLYFDEPTDGGRAAWIALVWAQLGISVVLAAAAWATGPAWARLLGGVTWSGPLQAGVALALATSWMVTLLAVLRAAGRSRAFAGLLGVQVILGGSLAIALAPAGAGWFVAGLAAGGAVSALVGIVLIGQTPRWSRAATVSGLALSLPFMVHLGAGWALSLSDRLVIGRYGDIADVGRYHLAYAIGSVALLITDAAQLAWVPRYYGAETADKAGLAGRLAAPVTRLVAAVAVAVVLVAPAVIWVIAPDGMDVPLEVVALVAAVAVVRVPFLLSFAVISDARRSTPIARASVLAAAVNIALNLFVVPRWGLTGAGVSTLLAYALMSAVTARRATRDGEPISIVPLLPVWATSIAVLLGLTLLPDGWLGGVLRALAVAVAATVALLAARTIGLSEGLGGRPAARPASMP